MNMFNDDAAAGPPMLDQASPYLTATEAATYLRMTVQGIYSLSVGSRIRQIVPWAVQTAVYSVDLPLS